VHYRHALKSAVFGMAEQIDMANEIASDKAPGVFATCHILDPDSLSGAYAEKPFDYILLPPAASSRHDESRLDRVKEEPDLSNCLQKQNEKGTRIAAACMGVYMVAKSGLLDGEAATTHWGVADEMQNAFPAIKFDTDAILVDNGNIITAGGLMAWVDLMLCIVQRVFGPETMSMLAKQMLVDTGHRQQQFYKQFIPNKQHGDKAVALAQDYIDKNFFETITMQTLCQQCHLTERTLQRRFQQLFHCSPTEYIQKTRVQYACQQLELSKAPVKQIALNAGYLEINGFRKVFQRITGLTPSEYRKQFMRVFV
jgi:transcriptional regulator GlxA family with amidase domain